MSSIHPTPRTWTLRFKHARTTILLHCDPLQKLSSVKADLLKALAQTHPDGYINGHAIPQNSEDVRLARPLDANDLSQGWEALEKVLDEEEDLFGSEAKGKGKGRAGATGGKVKDKDRGLKECPQGVGLRDGGVVAFKFRSEDEDDAGGEEELEIEDDGDDVLVGLGKGRKETWDVQVPTMEETYGEDEGLATE